MGEDKAKTVKTILSAASLTIGTAVSIDVSSLDNPTEIEAVKFTLDIVFPDGLVSNEYWGGNYSLAGVSSPFSSTDGVKKGVEGSVPNVFVSATQSLWAETSGLNLSTPLSFTIAYAGSTNFTFTLTKVDFFYSNGLQKNVETVAYDKTILTGEGTSTPQEFPLADFHAHNLISKVVFDVLSVGDQSYVGGTLVFKGLSLTETNTYELGSIMKPNASNEGKLTLYLDNYLAFDPSVVLTLACYWAPASAITIKGITLYTDIDIIPSAPTNLTAHNGNASVSLEWDGALSATSYDVYCDGALASNVTGTNAVVTSLVNEKEYTFAVKSKNSKGTSDFSNAVKATPSSSAEYNQFLDGLNTDLEKSLGATNLANAYKNSLISKGNNARFKAALAKMQKGEDVTVGYIGGSITVGEKATLFTSEHLQKGYAYYSYEYLAQAFGTGSNVKYLNAAISGTGSEVGIVRAQEDLFDHSPDLIFIEFAVNNGNNDLQNETYESLVRKALAQPQAPAVVLLFSWTTYSGGAVEQYMTDIGTHYCLPMVSIHKGLNPFASTIWNGFQSGDGLHPGNDGYKLYGKLVGNLMRSISKDAVDEAVVYPMTAKSGAASGKYDTLKMINHKSTLVTSTGSFVGTTTNSSATGVSHVTAFENGWEKTTTTANDPLTFSLHCKNLIVTYKSNTSFHGKLIGTYVNKNDASDSGNISQDVTEYNDAKPGWNNPVSLLLLDKGVDGEYTFSFAFDSAEGVGVILAFGYSD